MTDVQSFEVSGNGQLEWCAGCAGARRELAEALVEQKRLREQVGKADAAVGKLRQQLADAKEELAERAAAVAAAATEKDAFAAEAADARAEVVAVQASLSQAKAAAAEVRLTPVCVFARVCPAPLLASTIKAHHCRSRRAPGGACPCSPWRRPRTRASSRRWRSCARSCARRRASTGRRRRRCSRSSSTLRTRSRASRTSPAVRLVVLHVLYLEICLALAMCNVWCGWRGEAVQKKRRYCVSCRRGGQHARRRGARTAAAHPAAAQRGAGRRRCRRGAASFDAHPRRHRLARRRDAAQAHARAALAARHRGVAGAAGHGQHDWHGANAAVCTQLRRQRAGRVLAPPVRPAVVRCAGCRAARE